MIAVTLLSAVLTVTPARFGSVYRTGESVGFVASGRDVLCRVYDAEDKLVFQKCVGLFGTQGGIGISHAELGGRYGGFRLVCSEKGAVSRDVRFVFLPGRRRTADPDPFFGVGIHPGHGWARGFLQPLELLPDLGVGAVREDLPIESWEDGNGGFRIPKDFDVLQRTLEGYGIAVNGILTTSRPYTLEKLAPERFESWAAFLAKTYVGRRMQFEIWNEPHNFAFKTVYGGTYSGPEAVWIPKFVEFTRRVKTAFKNASCELPVLLTAEDFEPSFLPMVDQGIADRDDIISIHPYCHDDPHPEFGVWFYRDGGAAVRKRVAEHGGCHRFRATEAGWTTVSVTGKVEHAFVGCYPVVTFLQQAQYIVRMFVIGRQIGLEQAFQYDYVNDGTNRFHTEHNFGLLTENFEPKPSFAAVATLTSMLSFAQPEGDEGGEPMRVRIYRHRAKNGRTVYVAWGVKGATTAPVPPSLGDDYRVFDLFGNPLPRFADGILRLDERPIYLVSGSRK